MNACTWAEERGVKRCCGYSGVIGVLKVVVDIGGFLNNYNYK